MVARIIPAPVEVQEQGGSFQMNPKKVEFRLDPKSKIPAEGYTLNVTRTRVKAVASTPAGLFYARQTLAQLQQDGQVPCVKSPTTPATPGADSTWIPAAISRAWKTSRL